MWLSAVSVRPETFPRDDCYPFTLPCLRGGPLLEFRSPVTFFVGENGSGKSTLLEAILRRAGTHIWTRSKRHIAHGNPYEDSLQEHLDLTWCNGTVPGGFFSAETFRERAEYLDDVSLVDPGQLRYFGGRVLLNQSHGQGMLTFFRGRYRYRGLYGLDEPEAALSPASPLELVALLDRYARAGHAQFLIATHSPILLALPGARLLAFAEDGISETRYEDTEHYRLYRDFLADPAGYLETLGSPEADGLPEQPDRGA
jgi:predicted ATPase